jgi:hypothetical protein
MKKRSREISVFSLSAIDLFACAMGGFLLVAIVLLQFRSKEDPKPPEPQPVVEKEKDEKEDKKQKLLAFLGIVTEAKSFVVLVDMSGSMEDYEELAQRTIDDLLGQMDDSYQCQIIGFQGHATDNVTPPTLTSWQAPGTTAAMDQGNIALAKDFSARILANVRGGTPTYMALVEALSYPVEAIFLLSDGEPNDFENGMEILWPDIVSRITKLNAGQKKIFCVALGYYRKKEDFVDFLDALSKENGGRFIGVGD